MSGERRIGKRKSGTGQDTREHHPSLPTPAGLIAIPCLAPDFRLKGQKGMRTFFRHFQSDATLTFRYSAMLKPSRLILIR